MPHLENLQISISKPLCISQMIGVLAWLASWTANPFINKDPDIVIVICIAGILLSFLFMINKRKLSFLRMSGVLYIVALTILFKIEILRMGANSNMWSLLVTSLLLTGMSVFFLRLFDYVLASVLVWWLMWDINIASIGVGFNIYCVFVVSCVALGLHTNFTFVNSIKLAFNARDEFKRLAETDPLTNAPNRRALIQRIENFLSAGKIDELWFVMVDIDDFKKINDTHGHEVGDLVLVAFSDSIKLSPNLLQFGRVGGEEFGLLFSAKSVDVIGHDLHCLLSVSKNCLSGQISFSFSGGVVHLERESNVTELFKKADVNLYAAKKHGKACVFFEGEVIASGHR